MTQKTTIISEEEILRIIKERENEPSKEYSIEEVYEELLNYQPKL